MTAVPSTRAALSIDRRISAIASGIVATIPEAQVRLFGSRARGTPRPDSDVNLLITVPDPWLAGHDRVQVLGDLWRRFSSHQLPLDLLLYSESEVIERQQYRSAVITQAYRQGFLLETAHLLRSPRNAASLLSAQERAQTDEVPSVRLNELEAQLAA